MPHHVPWTVNKVDHPGSSAEELKNEPSWGEGHHARVGFKSRADRVAGTTHMVDEDLAEDPDAIKRFEHLKQVESEHDLVNFRELVEDQKVRIMRAQLITQDGGL